jgi:hypothetical protein
VDCALFDGVDDACLYAHGFDPFTNTSMPSELQGSGYSSATVADALKQEDYGALLQSGPTRDAIGVGQKAPSRAAKESSTDVLPSVAARAHRTHDHIERTTGAHGSRSSSMSASTTRLMDSALYLQEPSTKGDSIATEDRAVLTHLQTIIHNLPDATRANFRESLLRLMRSAKVAGNELSSVANVDKDSNYVDRSVANVLYHRYSDVTIPTTSSQNNVQTSNDVSTSRRRDETHPIAFPAA